MNKLAALKKTVKLREHQEEGVKKFLANKDRQIFAWGTGSGKTIGSLAAVERSGAKKVLILPPAALVKNYQDSIDNFVEDKDRGKYHVMSYEKFRMNPEKYFSNINPDMLVVDEVHREKNKDSVSYKSIKSVRPKVDKFLGLTATPAQNSPYEVIPLLNLTVGKDSPIKTQKEFDKKFTEYKKVYPKGLKGILARAVGLGGEQKVLKNTKELRQKVAPFIDKNEPSADFLSNFPETRSEDVKVQMSPKQEKMYKYFLSKDLNFFDRMRVHYDLPPKARDAKNFFARLTHARQISNTPEVLSKHPGDPIKSSPKLQKAYENLKKHLAANPKHKVVIYSNFLESGLKPFESALKRDKISYGVFTGKVTKKSKNQDVESFNKSDKKVLLVSPSGAEGLDLKGTTLLQVIDKSWNPAKNKQVEGRVARFKSHANLPKNMRNVSIQNYYSTLRPGLFARLLGKKQSKTKSIDEYVSSRAKEKSQLNTEFYNLITTKQES